MAQIPDYTAVGTVNPRPGPEGNAPSGQSPESAALGDIGATIGRIGEQREQRESNLALATAKSQLYTQGIDLENTIRESADPSTWQAQYEAGMKKIAGSIRGNLQGGELQSAFDIDTTADVARMAGTLATAGRQRFIQTQGDALNQLNDDNLNAALKTPDEATRARLFDATKEANEAALARGIITAQQSHANQKNFAENYGKGRADLLDPQSRLDQLSEGMTRNESGQEIFAPTNDWRDMLRPDQRAQMIAAATSQVHTLSAAAEVEERRRQTAKDKAEREAAEGSYNNFATQIIKDPTRVDTNAIANDPNLRGEQKIAILNALHTALTRDGAGEGNRDSKTYGAGFFDTYKRLHLPANDPRKITDVKQLWDLAGPGGSLTVAGVEKLSTEMAGKRTPEGEGESQMKAQFFKNAHKELSSQDDAGYFKDPHGEENYLKFMAQALPAYEEARKAGKTPTQILNPDSPDYLGKIIGTFKRSHADEVRDGVAGDDTAPAASPGWFTRAPDTSTPEKIRDAYKAGHLTKPQAIELLGRHGYQRTAPTAAAPAPTGVTVPAAIH